MTRFAAASRSSSDEPAAPASRQHLRSRLPRSMARAAAPRCRAIPEYCAELNARMRAEKLKFGDRVHCPFLRPFFLTADDDARVRAVAEAIAALGERVVRQSLADPALLAQAALTPRRRAARANRSRLRHRQHRFAPRRVPPARFAAVRRVQRRIAGRPRLCRNARRSFLSLPVMARFDERYRVRTYAPMKMLLEGLARELSRMGRHGVAAADRHRRLARSAHLERVRNPASALRARRRAHDHQRSARSRVRRQASHRAGPPHRPRLPPRADQRHSRAPGRVPRAGRRLRGGRRLRRQHASLQDSAQEGVLRRAHRRAQRRALQRRRARADSPPHSLDAAARGHQNDARRRILRPARLRAAPARRFRAEAERRIRRHRRHARLGEQTKANGTPRSIARSPIASTPGWRRNGSPFAAKCFRCRPRTASRCATCWSTSRRISSAGKWPDF